MLALVNIVEKELAHAFWQCQGEEIEVTVSSQYITESTTARFSFYTDYYQVKMILGRHTVELGEAKVAIKVADIEKIIHFTNLTANVSRNLF